MQSNINVYTENCPGDVAVTSKQYTTITNLVVKKSKFNLNRYVKITQVLTYKHLHHYHILLDIHTNKRSYEVLQRQVLTSYTSNLQSKHTDYADHLQGHSHIT